MTDKLRRIRCPKNKVCPKQPGNSLSFSVSEYKKIRRLCKKCNNGKDIK